MSLYHYTKISSLQSILENQELWISHIDYMNDPQELHGGVEVFEQALNMLQQTAQLQCGDLDNQQEPILMPFQDFKETAKKMDIFVGSFSTKCNLLSQWKYYGDYAIEFDEELIHKMANNITKLGDTYTEVSFRTATPKGSELNEDLVRSTMQKTLKNPDFVQNNQKYSGLIKATFDNCKYENHNMLEHALNLLIEHIFMLADKSDKNDPLRQTENIFKKLPELYLQAALYKNKAYEEEEEKRVVILGSAGAKLSFREWNNVLLPYYKLKFPISCIKSIWVGPRDKNEQEKAKKSLEKFLKYTYMNHPNVSIPTIKLSSIPFRK